MGDKFEIVHFVGKLHLSHSAELSTRPLGLSTGLSISRTVSLRNCFIVVVVVVVVVIVIVALSTLVSIAHR